MTARILAIICLLAPLAKAAVSPLADAGYSALPAPQIVKLSGGTVSVGKEWKIQLDDGVRADDVAVATLKEELAERCRVQISAGPAQAGDKLIHLSIAPASVEMGQAQDADRATLAEQAYRIEISEAAIHIFANAPAGLFYGIETLAQIARKSDNGAQLPAGEITDWPDLQLREIYWDDAHHLERPEAMKHAIRQAAFFKINGFVIKLEGHFQYRSAPALVEPYALSPAELQDLTDYAGRYHVQLIPYLDAPAHIAFILKHPEYAGLRAFADSNYELSTTNADAEKLITGMFGDLLDVNKGVKYFYLSTDEPYYLGMSTAGHPSEADRLKELKTPGKVLAAYLQKTAAYLHDKGRTVVFWGEYPMKPADVADLPAYLVNGETDNGEFDAACKARGIRQTIYTSIEGEEKLFPDYVLAPAERRLHKREGGKPRVAEAIETINAAGARKNADLMGMLVAGWGDMGLHPETFWLGYATVTAAGWNLATEADRASGDFYRLFYGPSAEKMDRVYALLSMQAQFWSESWDETQSAARKGIWGNSNSIYNPRHPAHDQTLKLPPVPKSQNLAIDGSWPTQDGRRLELVKAYFAENEELTGLLHRNIEHAQWNRYNLEVFDSIAQLCRQNLVMLQKMAAMELALESAARQAGDNHPADAVAALDDAVRLADEMRRERNDVLQRTTATWYRSWYPRVAEANGRKFLHELDDVKDHLPDRTVGMEYLVYRELNLPMGKWVEGLQAVRNAYAKAHQVEQKEQTFDWSEEN